MSSCFRENDNIGVYGPPENRTRHKKWRHPSVTPFYNLRAGLRRRLLYVAVAQIGAAVAIFVVRGLGYRYLVVLQRRALRGREVIQPCRVVAEDGFLDR